MRPVKGLGLLAALTIALGMVAVQPSTAAADTTAQTAIKNLAWANRYLGPCDMTTLGDWSFKAADGYTSCANKSQWCGIFASWVWSRSGHVYTSGLGHTPDDFHRYGNWQLANGQKPAVGDVVIFSSSPRGISQPMRSHIAIVYSVDSSALVGTIAGNEGPGYGTVQRRYFDYTTLSSTNPADAYWAYEYVKPRTH